MDKFLTQNGLNMISVLLVIAAAGYAFYQWITAKIAEQEAAAAKADEIENPPRYHVEVGHVANLLANLDTLRSPLPQFAKRDAGAEYPDPRDVADLARGTSKNVLIAAARRLP